MKSMTGFGRGQAATEAWRASVEVSAVNRKQAEVVVQLPREIAAIEPRVRKAVQANVSRGRVQVMVTLERAEGAAIDIRVNAAMARAFHRAFVELGEAIGQPVPPVAADYLRQQGILTLEGGEADAEEAWHAIGPALTDAMAALTAMRSTEGAHLEDDCKARLSTLAGFVARIAAAAPAQAARQRELLVKRLRDAGLDLAASDERVAKELALFADRCDVSEEITRLESHFTKFREYLEAPEPPGRALDFLCQEMFREFNTIGSKANDAGISHAVVESKTELEKIREQVQNIE